MPDISMQYRFVVVPFTQDHKTLYSHCAAYSLLFVNREAANLAIGVDSCVRDLIQYIVTCILPVHG